MEIGRVGSGPAPVDPAAGMRGPALSPSLKLAPPGADAITGLLRELSESDVLKLLETIERPPLPDSAARVEEVVKLAAEGKITMALERLAEFAPLDPERAAALPADPRLTPMRAQAETLLLRLTAAAHLDAQARVAHASEVAPPEMRTEPALQLANRLLEAGGYANAMTAAHLAQLLIERYPPVTTTAAKPAPARRMLWERTQQLWRRAPLLVLLLGWLVFGLLGCLVLLALASPLTAGGFEIWGVGFLALVGFGFYMRIRHIRF